MEKQIGKSQIRYFLLTKLAYKQIAPVNISATLMGHSWMFSRKTKLFSTALR